MQMEPLVATETTSQPMISLLHQNKDLPLAVPPLQPDVDHYEGIQTIQQLSHIQEPPSTSSADPPALLATEKASEEPVPQSPTSSKRPHILIDMHTTNSGQEMRVNPYEQERLERIKRNHAVLHSLGLRQIAQDLKQDASAAQHTNSKSIRTAAPKPRRARVTKSTTAPTRASRHSSRRLRGDATDDNQALQQISDEDTIEEQESLMSMEGYFKSIEKDISSAVWVDGFKGWVNPAVCQEYGIPATRAEWEACYSSAGGSSKKTIKGGGKRKGGANTWSSAKAFSATQLQNNPNSYFYRHVAPNQQQSQGEWSPEEHEKFMSTLKEHGAGDQWGLFASYVGSRVGYQCASYYREIVLPSGLVLDDAYMMGQGGKAVYKGGSAKKG